VHLDVERLEDHAQRAEEMVVIYGGAAARSTAQGCTVPAKRMENPGDTPAYPTP
jgi:hypothetical protein